MKIRASLLMMILTGSLAATAAEPPAFRYKPLAKGDSAEQEAEMRMDFQLEVLSEGESLMKSKLKFQMSELSRQNILEANQDGPTKVRIHYVKLEETETSDEGTQSTVNPRQGKTFIVGFTPEGLQITDEKGATIGLEDRAELEDEFDSLGQRDPLCDYLAGKTLSEGQKIDDAVIRDSILGSSFESDGVTLDELTLQFRKFKSSGGSRIGIFEAKMKISGVVEESLKVSAEFKGEIEVATEGCRLLQVEMSGPLQMSGTQEVEGMVLEMRAQGTGRFEIKAKYK
ncbi:MAG TPA: hypothetical protein VF789_29110 [Thermoanaerobaculia bacterium]